MPGGHEGGAHALLSERFPSDDGDQADGGTHHVAPDIEQQSVPPMGGSSGGGAGLHDDAETGPLLLLGDQVAAAQRAARARRKRHRNIGLLVCFVPHSGGLALVAGVLATSLTGRRHRGGHGGGSDGNGFVTPSLRHDYRGRARRVETAGGGVVAADQSACSELGAGVLQQGGNAVDAAVATALCQGVMNPFASGIGGGFFMSVRAPNGSHEFIDAREVAPSAATWDMYDGMPGNASTIGGLAVAVPLELKGLHVAWQRWGSLPWAALVQPAAELAASGYPAFPYLVYSLSDTMVALLSADRPTAEAFLVRTPSGGWRAPRVGEHCCRRPVLAATLAAVAKEGPAWLYSPERAEGLAAEVRAQGGIMTASDILDSQPVVGPLLELSVAGYTLLTPPPPSSAAILGMAARIMAGFPRPSPTGSPAKWCRRPESDAELLYEHQTVEAMKEAFALRLGLGDPGPDGSSSHARNITAVLDAIDDEAFTELLRSDLKNDGILNVTQYGRQYNPYNTNNSAGALPDDHGTTHISVVDGTRMAVSITSTVNGPFGALFTSPSTGMLFNNEMDDFSRPDLPNAYGLAPAEANFIASKRRPLSSMSPTIITEGGELRMVVGASGGPRILTATLQTILRILFMGWDPEDAIQVPRLHHQLLPYVVMYENYTLPDFFGGMTVLPPPLLLSYLAGKGNELQASKWMVGNTQVIYAVPGSNRLVGVSDLRKDGAPAVAPG